MKTESSFDKPSQVSKLELAFGGKMNELLPAWKDIPDEFKRHSKWLAIIRHWFYQGLPADASFFPKEGIDGNDALNHVAAVLRSWEPKHEHKEAGCAYLLSLWFHDIQLP